MYDGQQVLAILDETGNFVSAYVHGSEIDDPLMMVTDYDKDNELDVLTFLKDHLGSVKFITNEAGQVIEEISYSAYGETQIKLRGSNKVKVGNNFYYTGRELEPETGDYYYRARYYDPYSQKFLSEDPIGFASGDINLYRYVFNNPLTFTDPSGEYIQFVIGGIRFLVGKYLGEKIGKVLPPNEDEEIRKWKLVRYPFQFLNSPST